MAQKKNKVALYAALCSGFLAAAANAKEIEMNMARMQAMDKITGKVSEIDVPVNGEATFGSFSIVVRMCATRPPEETPENFAFVDVVDNYTSDKPVNVFKGWMMSSSPALNAVEHPIYDVWLLKCYNGDTKAQKLLNKSELEARDKILPASISDEVKTADVKSATETTTADNQEITAETVPETTVEQGEVVNNASQAMAPMQEENVKAEIQEDGAPKSLLNIAEPAAPAPETNAALAPSVQTGTEVVADSDVVDTVLKDIKTIQAQESPTPNSQEAPVAAASSDELVIPEAAPLLNEPALVEVKIQNEELIVPEAVEEDQPEAQEALISFDDEIEEEGFDLNADALKH